VVTESRDVDAVPRFPRHSERWTDWGWPEQVPTDPNAFARQRERDAEQEDDPK
jgi:hypothetical protein